MKCSNSFCGNTFEAPANVLGECTACHDKRLQKIITGTTDFAASMIRWMGKVEEGHGKTIFYSDEFASTDKKPFVIVTDQIDQTLQSKGYEKTADTTQRQMAVVKSHLQKMPQSGGYVVSSLPSQIITKLSWNGTAEGFVGASKDFHLMTGTAPSEAIRAFILGRLTVCECEGIALAVFLNAICDLVGDKVFDRLFPRLTLIGTDPARHNKRYIRKTPKPDESAIAPGDWVYLTHSSDSLKKFQDLAAKNRMGGAASGWNLVCVEAGANGNRYLGFGMSNQGQGMTLEAIGAMMIKSCGGDPADKHWHLYLHFFIRPNLHGLQKLVEKELELAH